MKSNKSFSIATYLVLVLTTLSLVHGWLGIGYFIPRAIYLMFVALLWIRLFAHIDFFFLLMYFTYSLITNPSVTPVGLIANFMEFAIPMLVAHYIIDKNDYVLARRMAIFAIALSILIMILTISANIIEPGVVREMVYYSAFDMQEEILRYSRMGVCSYSFALISMCLVPVFLHRARNERKNKLFYIGCAILTFYFVYITGVTTCLIICVFLIIVFLLSNRFHKTEMLYMTVLLAAMLLYMFGFAVVELAAPLFEGTEYESHFAGLQDFFGIQSNASETYDFEERVDLYKYSWEAFIANPIFGDATSRLGGHNYFLDRLGGMGIVGTSFLAFLLYIRFKAAYYFIPQNGRIVYLTCTMGFIILGFLKNMSGIDYWTYMFVYIPCILTLVGEKEKTKLIKEN